MKKTDNKTLASALRILAKDIQSPDDIPQLCLREAADRIEELNQCRELLVEIFGASSDWEDWIKLHSSDWFERTEKQLEDADE